MSAARRFRSRLRAFLRPDAADAEAAREIASHLGLLEDEGLRRGLAPGDAARAARLALGSDALHFDGSWHTFTSTINGNS